MYLSELNLYNFRRFSGSYKNKQPGLVVHFHKGLNIIIGENDSGKTAIIDAIRLMLGDVSDDFQRITDDDFHATKSGLDENTFQIEGIFCDLSEREAGIFLDWLSFDKKGNYELRISLSVEKKKNDNDQVYLDHKIVAGESSSSMPLSASARSFLKVTYLKPLRNANDELTPGFRSHLPKMLMAHSTFSKDNQSKSELERIMKSANLEIENFFDGDANVSDQSSHASLNTELSKVLSQLYDQQDQSKSKVSLKLPEATLSQILNQLSLNPDSRNLGLGNMNLLFIATELALLDDHLTHTVYGPNLMLVEELEAHLHVQAQIRLIKYIEKYIESHQSKASMQFILTSHSVSLTASVDQKLLIYLHDGQAYPMGPSYTMLKEEDYRFLNRFLDATKANLFFAKGLIFVEGYAENILLPVLADLIGYSLHENGISIVNVGGRSFDNYVKLFSRKNGSIPINLPISIVRDSDVRPYTYRINQNNIDGIRELLTSNDFNKNRMGNTYSTFNQLQKSLKLKFSNENFSKISQIAYQLLDGDELATSQGKKAEKLENAYHDLNVKQQVFVSPAWTLEYSLLKSPLGDLLLQSIADAKFNLKADAENKKREFIATSQSGDLIQIYSQFEHSDVSKAETAQFLAEKLYNLDEEKRNKLKVAVLGNSYCAYLVDAIKFACGRDEDD
ncbi:ATP-dependent nuclease [Levilactobacillus hammesii]|uniref:Uncharacterized protein n=1 Tax=Levilactobacillus hammesii DSM 16381 TaxID=1423753 RepID=A0A0R1UW65_9LACO|nr:AAA family ATPase [Levilactobacillus hammesii]KRL94267.1 hypothetical protein FD28_GL000412 [Levilactobacillus hammesii DSM 16381]